MQQLRRIDWIGGILFIGSTTGFLIPLTWGGTMYPWTSWRTLVPLLVSAAGLVAFVVWEERYAREPLIRTRVTKNRTVAVTYLGDFLQGLLLWCNLYFMPLYFQVSELKMSTPQTRLTSASVTQAVMGDTPIKSAINLFPSTFTVAPAAIVTGAMITKFGVYRWAIWSGWVLVTVGFAARVCIPPKSFSDSHTDHTHRPSSTSTLPSQSGSSST